MKMDLAAFDAISYPSGETLGGDSMARKTKQYPTANCPCCGQKTNNVSPKEALRYVYFAPIQKRIIDVLVSQFGQPIQRMDLVDRVYADRSDGGPDDAEKVVATHLSIIRRDGKLEKVGLTIPRGFATYGTKITWLAEEKACKPALQD